MITTTPSGNSNIIIQGIGEDTITLNINGEIREIQNQLDELKTLLQSKKVQNVQYAEKIYNIEQINEANFGFVTGKKTFNEHLTKTLIEVIRPHSERAQWFLKHAAKRPNWEGNLDISKKAKAIINASFVGVIGLELKKLMALGEEGASETKIRLYIEKCLHIAQRSLDLVCFALLSKLWDFQKQKQFSLTKAQRNTLSFFFQNTFEPSIEEQLSLLKSLLDIYRHHNLALPVTELADTRDEWTEGSKFQQTCQSLQALKDNFEKGQFSLLDCFEAETQLAEFLKHFHFLAKYKMASIKEIGYKEIRHDPPHFIHSYTALGIDNKNNMNVPKMNYASEAVHTDAVLMYKGPDYQENIDLFPFVIDYNALTFQKDPMICFYHCRDIADQNRLEYLILGKNSVQIIEYIDILKSESEYSKIMMDTEKKKTLNLDIVVAQFHEAQKCILGEA